MPPAGALAIPAEPRTVRSTFKPRDVEEMIDFYVNRPIAGRLALAIDPLPVSPNQITVASGIAGIASGLCIGFAAPGDPWLVPVGGVLLFLSILLDCADGQLARLRKQSSMVGRALDGYVDVVSTAAVFIGFAFFLWRAGFPGIWIHALGWSAGLSMKWHVHGYDHAKNIYLGNVLPLEERSKNLPTIEEILAEREEHRRRGEWFSALLLLGLADLTRSQRTGWQSERIGLGLPGMESDAQRAEYRELFQGTMRLWTWNGLATHLALFLVATALTLVHPGAVFGVWAFMLGPMNVATLALGARERQIERALRARLTAGR